jgi:hypothetical protein
MKDKTKASIPLADLEALITKDGTFSIQNVRNISTLKQLWRLDIQAYSTEDKPYDLSFQEFSNWWRQYPLGSKVLTVSDRIVSSIGIYPLREDQYSKFLKGELEESKLIPVSLKDCKKERQHYWYVSGILKDEHYIDLGLKIHPLYHLLKESLGLWLTSGHIDFPISIASLSISKSGSTLLSKFGFVQQGVNSEEQILYELKLSSIEELQTLLRNRRLI